MDGMRSRRRVRQKITGELGAAKSCPPSSEGAGRRRTSAMEQRAVLRPYLHELDKFVESKYLNLSEYERHKRRKQGKGNVLYVR
jgi:hypothetical protein